MGQEAWVLALYFPLTSDTTVDKSFNLSVFLLYTTIKYKQYVTTAWSVELLCKGNLNPWIKEETDMQIIIECRCSQFYSSRECYPPLYIKMSYK